MSVVLYSHACPHPAGFIGYRVAVMIDGKHKQKYFSLNRAPKLEQHKKAHKLNARWLQEKERRQTYRDNQAIQSVRSIHGTGVKGIALRYCYSPDKRGNKKAYKHKRFVVQGSNNLKGFNRGFEVTTQGWYDAVAYLAKQKQLSRWKHLLKRCPV